MVILFVNGSKCKSTSYCLMIEKEDLLKIPFTVVLRNSLFYIKCITILEVLEMMHSLTFFVARLLVFAFPIYAR